jgi:hypothetical protein
LFAQPDYPVAPVPVTNLNLAEYFFDTDPGNGNGNPVALPVSTETNLFSFSASLNGITSGFHRLYLRSRNVNGVWSHTNNTFFDNYFVPAYALPSSPAGNITELEYFIDTDPGFGNGNRLLAGSGTDISSQQTIINVTGLSTGVHRLYIRSRDQSGHWSLVHFGIFDNSIATPYPVAQVAAPPIGELEYYIDTDPGFGNGTAVSFTAGTDISNLSINIPLNSITAGQHTIYIRSRQNPWSLSAYAEFVYASVLPVSWLYVKGEIKNEQGVISWATGSEENTDKFLIEHSTDGRVFTTVGEKSAAGNSSSSRQYSFTHAGITSGLNYYRIRQQDKDGKYTYSKVILLLNKQSLQETIIAPNPVQDILHIAEPVTKLIRKIEICDMGGRVLISKNIGVKGNVFSIQATSLVNGTYLLKIFYEKTSKSFIIVKK